MDFKLQKGYKIKLLDIPNPKNWVYKTYCSDNPYILHFEDIATEFSKDSLSDMDLVDFLKGRPYELVEVTIDDNIRYVIRMLDVSDQEYYRYVRLSVQKHNVVLKLCGLAGASILSKEALLSPAIQSLLQNRQYEIIELPDKYGNKVLNIYMGTPRIGDNPKIVFQNKDIKL